MKTTLFSVVAMLIIITAANAQSAFGIQGGGAFSNIKISSEDADMSFSSNTGLTLGLAGKFAISKSFSFRPELNFVQKGTKMNFFEDEASMHLNYLELPLNFVYYTGDKATGLFIGAGPSLAFGLSGKIEADEEEEEIKFGGGDDDDFKALDFGGNAIVGYELKSGLFFSANYTFGFSNMINQTEGDDSKMHNNSFGIKLGFMFGGKH